MLFIDDFLLGLIQGISEFLPISSSGHLQIAKHLLHINTQKLNLTYDIFLHTATMFATLCLFYKHFFRFFKLFKIKTIDPKEKKHLFKYLIFMIITIIPVGLTGILFEKKLEPYFSSLILVSASYLMTTFFLAMTYFYSNGKKNLSQLSYLFPIMIGLSQAIAILPGVSRSGITIATALILGTHKKLAAEFSLMISIPIIFGAFLLKCFSLDFSLDIRQWDLMTLGHYLVGGISAFCFGLIALIFLLKIVARGKIYLFSFYTFLLSLFCFYLSFF